MDYPDYPCIPLDSTAARVMKPGIHYEPDIKFGQQIWDYPIETLPLPKYTINMIGQKRGKLTIVGYVGRKKKSGNNYHYWLVRCNCGKYEIRNGQNFRRQQKKDNQDDCCQICRHLQYLKNKPAVTLQDFIKPRIGEKS